MKETVKCDWLRRNQGDYRISSDVCRQKKMQSSDEYMTRLSCNNDLKERGYFVVWIKMGNSDQYH